MSACEEKGDMLKSELKKTVRGQVLPAEDKASGMTQVN